jgi:hypothetical protein
MSLKIQDFTCRVGNRSLTYYGWRMDNNDGTSEIADFEEMIYRELFLAECGLLAWARGKPVVPVNTLAPLVWIIAKHREMDAEHARGAIIAATKRGCELPDDLLEELVDLAHEVPTDDEGDEARDYPFAPMKTWRQLVGDGRVLTSYRRWALHSMNTDLMRKDNEFRPRAACDVI